MTGRPPFVATAEDRARVAEMASCAMPQADIARVIGCTMPTLRKHFREELSTGAAVKRAEVVSLLYANARAGNVSAQKHLEIMTRPPETAAAAEMGKKAMRQVKAEQSASAGKFAAPTAPKLIVINGK